MNLQWMQSHRLILEKIIKFGNAYAANYSKKGNFGTNIEFSPSQIQTFEYILDSEDRNEKMSVVARTLGISKSTFSKNVNFLVRNGMLDKYWLGNNRKDIYVKPTQKGKEIYAKYVNYVLDACFNEIFRIADDISDEDNERFAKILDIFAEAFLRYFSEKPNGNEEIDILIKVE
jgi:DNA-binding MarR family transcriptional regulator